MKVYYDWTSKEWFGPSNATLGNNSQPLKSCSTEAENVLSLNLLNKKDNAGPVIGILSGKGKDQSIAGNGPLFKALQKKILQNNGISFVFTAEDIQDDSVNGYIYLPAKDKWAEARFPLPHLVYNRVPFRKLEQKETFQKAFLFFKKNKIPFFNPGFLDKYEVCQLLKAYPPLQKYIPDTILITDKSKLSHFIHTYKNIYLKPASGSKGKGIYRLSMQDGEKVIINGLNHAFNYTHFEGFWNEWSIPLTDKAYIAQEAMSSAKIDGKRFDFRILVHFCNGSFQVTGIGIRQAQGQEITTHIPNGGILIPYEMVRTQEHDDFIQMAAAQTGKLLEKSKGFYGEFSIDAGRTDEGNYVIYEINSKPMSFDELSIEKKRIKELTHLFFARAGF
ncbi:YheC/YheD family endospore coat-associated protein [Cytobacillus sp. NCCP-133]|uniref:YheC/YheD family endospore coat-associated protein n=1 Tax=Cytobacillus sp. NCCP-133 TaxID=766848 RepID=UPI0022312747|nr:YheC/YheD family protein [Cytobacillus sp. NCCP-133]GLB58773.1 hypothetical protein NCCP133_09060 [Cytobacillus sp. NCCP-133]